MIICIITVIYFQYYRNTLFLLTPTSAHLEARHPAIGAAATCAANPASYILLLIGPLLITELLIPTLTGTQGTSHHRLPVAASSASRASALDCPTPVRLSPLPAIHHPGGLWQSP